MALADPAAPSRHGRWLLVAAWCAIAAGVGLRIAAVVRMDIWQDGAEYVAMGRAFSQGHGFLLPDSERMGRVLSWGPGYSHHFPPAYPFALGVFFRVLGFGLVQAKLATLAISLAVLGVVYATTRDLYGGRRAALVTSVIAVDPSLVWVTGVGLSENFTLVFATLTLWAFVRSLADVRYLLPAGIAWTGVYLARSSAGAFGLLPVVAGVLWWWRFRRWRELWSPWSLAAGALFVAAAGLWGWRNHVHFGSWETSAYMSAAYRYGLAHPSQVAWALLGKGALFLLCAAVYAVPFLPELRASLRRLRDAETSVLWLFAGVIWLLAWLVTAVFWPYEPRALFSLSQLRYVLLGVVPLLWIVVKDRTEVGALGGRWAGLVGALLVASTAVVLLPVRDANARAAEFIDPYLRDGDLLVLRGTTYKYDLDLHLSRLDRITITSGRPAAWPDFVFSGGAPPEPLPDGYAVVGRFEQRGHPASVTWVVASRRVIDERGVPTNLTLDYP